MYKPTNIIIGLVIFACIVTFPFWFNLGADGAAPEVSLDTPAINAMGEDAECIEDAEWMRENHMTLLSDWKTEVVREGNNVYVADNGQDYIMSLQNTCLECHSNYDEFCEACHDYSNVSPTCWTCHVVPEEVQ